MLFMMNQLPYWSSWDSDALLMMNVHMKMLGHTFENKTVSGETKEDKWYLPHYDCR